MPRHSRTEARTTLVVVVALVFVALIAGTTLFGLYVLPFLTAQPYSSITPGGGASSSFSINSQSGGIVASAGSNLNLVVNGLTPNGQVQIIASPQPGVSGGGSGGGGTTTTTSTTSTTSSTTVQTGLQTSLTVQAAVQGGASQTLLQNVRVFVDSVAVGTTGAYGTFNGQILTGQHTISCDSVSGFTSLNTSFTQSVTQPVTITCTYSISVSSGSTSIIATVELANTPINAGCKVTLSLSNGGGGSTTLATDSHSIAVFSNLAPQTSYQLVVQAATCFGFATTTNVLSGPVGTTTPVTLNVLHVFSAFSLPSTGVILIASTASSGGAYSTTYSVPSVVPVGYTFYMAALDLTTGKYSNWVDVTVSQGTDSCSALASGAVASDPFSQWAAQFNCGIFSITGQDPATMSIGTKFVVIGVIVLILAIVAYAVGMMARRSGGTRSYQQPQGVVR